MTINEVIAELRHRNRETAPDELVARWCSAVDSMVSRQVQKLGVPASYKWPEDENRELLIPEPWDGAYYHYCAARIDLDKRQYTDYNNEAQAFQDIYQDFAKDWNRNNTPERCGGFRVM